MMAVPFALPEDETNNLMLAVIFFLAQTRLQRNEENRHLQECMEELMRLLVEELERRSHSSDYDIHLGQTLVLLRQYLQRFMPTLSRIPRRSNFESCCDDCKVSLHEECPTEDCRQQVGLILRKIAEDESSAILKEGLEEEEEEEEKEEFVGEESLFSLLVPRVRRTFWTAVPLICIVGWHLFQISYSL